MDSKIPGDVCASVGQDQNISTGTNVPESVSDTAEPQACDKGDSIIESSTEDSEFEIIYNKRVILIIGKTGNGKSTVGNILLGEDKFQKGRGMSSTTVTATKIEETSIPEKGSTLVVIDTPDIDNLEMSESDARVEVSNWKEIAKPGPHVILLTVRCDVRYTAEEYAIYCQIKQLWGDDKEFCGRLIVGFTFGDRLDRNIDKELEDVSSDLKSVLGDAGRRYVVFKSGGDTKEQKEKLLEKAADADAMQTPGMRGYLLSFMADTDRWGRYIMNRFWAGCGYIVRFALSCAPGRGTTVDTTTTPPVRAGGPETAGGTSDSSVADTMTSTQDTSEH